MGPLESHNDENCKRMTKNSKKIYNNSLENYSIFPGTDKIVGVITGSIVYVIHQYKSKLHKVGL